MVCKSDNIFIGNIWTIFISQRYCQFFDVIIDFQQIMKNKTVIRKNKVVIRKEKYASMD